MSDQVVIWDFDGTLAHREGGWRGAVLAGLTQVNPGHGLTTDGARDGLRDKLPWHAPDRPHLHLDTPELWWREVRGTLRRIYLDHGIDVDLAEGAAIATQYIYTDPPPLGSVRRRGSCAGVPVKAWVGAHRRQQPRA